MYGTLKSVDYESLVVALRGLITLDSVVRFEFNPLGDEKPRLKVLRRPCLEHFFSKVIL